ncbi:hypothetical protein [Brevundimonas sp.]|uniref:hypothetical protein n=1 Tax=Brevundimonas sp. TaxID=1871086 RepID=UPI003561EC21
MPGRRGRVNGTGRQAGCRASRRLQKQCGRRFGVSRNHRTAPEADTRTFQSEDQAHLRRLTIEGSVADGNLNRVCVIQARRGGFDGARASVRPVMRQQGFAAEADLPADRSIWTRDGVTVSLRQPAGAAAIVRVTFSSLDAEGF